MEVYIGQLDRRVEILKDTVTQSTTGSRNVVETSLGEGWAKVEFVSGNESDEGQVISVNIRHYTLRYRDDMVSDGETYYIKDLKEGAKFNVHFIEQIGREEYLKCKVSRIE